MTDLGTSTAVRLAQYMLIKTLNMNMVKTAYMKKKNASKKMKIARGGKISLKLVENKMSTWETKCPCIGKQNVQMYSFKNLSISNSDEAGWPCDCQSSSNSLAKLL